MEEQLFVIVEKLGISRVRELLNQKYNSRQKYAERFVKLLDINGKYSYNTYRYIKEAHREGRRFIIPIFEPPHVPLLTNIPFRIDPSDVNKYLDHLEGYDKVVWRIIKLFLEGEIPPFHVDKSIKKLSVVKDGDKYDVEGNNFKGYNPYLFKGGLKKYYEIFGREMTCIVFNIS